MSRIALFLLAIILGSCTTGQVPAGEGIKHYCGRIVQTLPVSSTANGPSAVVVLRVQHLDRDVVVPVSWYTYTHAVVGHDTCFVLTRKEAGE